MLLVLLLSLSPLQAFCSWTEDFEALKSIPRSYEAAGTICEEIARLNVQKKYPAPQYNVLTGISYGNDQRVIGELDVIVFDTNINKVIQIAEVKCWKDLSDGLDKAHEQRARFLKNLRSSKSLIFRSTSSTETFAKEQFQYVKEFITIGQLGAVQAGYDLELPYTLKELKGFSYEMIRCQHNGQCVRP